MQKIAHDSIYVKFKSGQNYDVERYILRKQRYKEKQGRDTAAVDFIIEENRVGNVLEVWEGTSWGCCTSTGSVSGCWGWGQMVQGSQTPIQRNENKESRRFVK